MTNTFIAILYRKMRMFYENNYFLIHNKNQLLRVQIDRLVASWSVSSMRSNPAYYLSFVKVLAGATYTVHVLYQYLLQWRWSTHGFVQHAVMVTLQHFNNFHWLVFIFNPSMY